MNSRIFYQKYTKRAFDLIVSGLSIIALFPLFIFIAIAIRLDTKGWVIFVQERVGKNYNSFKMYKFRTMLTFKDSYYANGEVIANYDRITKMGSILRKTSMDELPQLINIFKGDMSIVGPRPTLSYQVERYTSNQARRLQVKPGLTGLAQVNGRNNLSWTDKIEYDLNYIEKMSFLKDLEIIFKTVAVVLKKKQVAFVHTDDEISKHTKDVRIDIGEIKVDLQKK